jgi:hypothetical protein
MKLLLACYVTMLAPFVLAFGADWWAWLKRILT